MNKLEKRYSLCLRFASLYNSEFRYDIVHNAWLYYLNKTGEDLFNKELQNESSYLYTVVKKAFYRWYYHERRGDKYMYFTTDNLSSADSPEELTHFNHTAELLKNKYMSKQVKNPVLASNIFDLVLQGYDQQSTATKLNVTKQRVQLYTKQLKQLAVNG